MNAAQLNLDSISVADLGEARAIAHRGIQVVSLVARENLPALGDDSHSNLGWNGEHQSFVSHTLTGTAGPVRCGLRLVPLSLYIEVGGARQHHLLTGQEPEIAADWLNLQLSEVGLNPIMDLNPPYELPKEVAAVKHYPLADEPGLVTLAAWYSLAQRLLEETRTHIDLKVGKASPVRCWPHHFDIATYISLEAGDPENARGIGVGLSPGDESYQELYFYISPWPHADQRHLPKPVAPGRWHTEGFVGSVARASDLLGASDVDATTRRFISQSVSWALNIQAT